MTKEWICEECEQENTEDDVECVACEAPRPAAASRFAGFKIARVVSVEAIPKTKLRAVKVQPNPEGDDSTELTIVTNARVDDGEQRYVVIATVGSTVEIDGEAVEVKKATIGGRKSEGMLCDSPMLGWKGDAAGAAVFLPNTYTIGDEPPATRP